MAVFNYKKYKISLRYDSKKTQGLKTGDIVRRQYLDGNKIIYSLFCVLDYGTEQILDDAGNTQERAYFIGALLEGDAPKSSELLDFSRLTNLFDLNRSGAMYLTSSDAQAPYMDIIDNIGRNESLCWPENIANTEQIDSTSQYVVSAPDALVCDYIPSSSEHSRICHIKRKASTSTGFIGLKQDFYQYITNPNRVLISYKIKSSRALNLTASLGYVDDVRIDGTVDVSTSTEWQYKLHAITVDWSGRHLRSFKMNLSTLTTGTEVWIADLNIILLSSLTNFADSTHLRIGKLDGVHDPVFGKLDGYGGYLQKLFASNSAHISGTLTAGDEKGFGSTFYAGKIHRNAFSNSLDVNFVTSVDIAKDITNPTGVGNVYAITKKTTMTAQTSQWVGERIGERYCFSFWIYAKQPCQLEVLQNDMIVDMLQITDVETHGWRRLNASFNLQDTKGAALLLSLTPTFNSANHTAISSNNSIIAKDELVSNANIVYFTAPQLESGRYVTQYQPTDSILNFTDEYGAWFSRGGIGGTMQNPLLKLNYDDNGGIGTRTNSFVLRADGSGHLANNNISWGADGKVVFGENVTLNWDNLSPNFQQEISSKSVKITGENTFTIYQNTTSTNVDYFPDYIVLSAIEENFEPTSGQRKWYCLFADEWCEVADGSNKSITLYPDDDAWGDSSSLTLKYEVITDSGVYADTFTVCKQYTNGYSVEIASTQGEMFKNGNCSTTLKALVYFQNNLLNNEELLNLTFNWKKYTLPDMENEDTEWFKAKYDDNGNLIHEAIDTTQQSITLNYRITSSDVFVCNVGAVHGFPYTFPIVL